MLCRVVVVGLYGCSHPEPLQAMIGLEFPVCFPCRGSFCEMVLGQQYPCPHPHGSWLYWRKGVSIFSFVDWGLVVGPFRSAPFLCREAIWREVLCMGLPSLYFPPNFPLQQFVVAAYSYPLPNSTPWPPSAQFPFFYPSSPYSIAKLGQTPSTLPQLPYFPPHWPNFIVRGP